jgi:hypothetical protein
MILSHSIEMAKENLNEVNFNDIIAIAGVKDNIILLERNQKHLGISEHFLKFIL